MKIALTQRNQKTTARKVNQAEINFTLPGGTWRGALILDEGLPLRLSPSIK